MKNDLPSTMRKDRSRARTRGGAAPVSSRSNSPSNWAVSGDHFEDLFENAPVGIYQSNGRQLLRANSQLARMFGYANGPEMVASGSDAAEFFMDPEQRTRIVERAIRSSSYVQEEVLYRRKDGSQFMGHVRMRALADRAGGVELLEGFVEDVTEHKRLEEQIRQTQKLEVIGQLAGGVAHDFNNILAATLMRLGLLLRTPELSAGMSEGLKEIENEILRGASLTRQLLLFGRRQPAQFRPLDINALIRDFLKMVRRVLGENIELAFQEQGPLPLVKADPSMIEQVIMNLCLNGRDAMAKGGKLTLSTALADKGIPSKGGLSDVGSRKFVCLSVNDSGCGMTAEVQRHLFEPFFTTKEVGKGTGLGLATVFGIVKQHSGWIEVESRIHEGSTFWVYLPALSDTPPEAAGEADADEIRGGSETILFVEDEASVRRTSALWLRKLGYAVLEAANGAEAQTLWHHHQGKVQLLLTDIIMPGRMSGMDLAECLKRENENLKVVFCSGYSGHLDQSRRLHEGAFFLDKPFDPVSLARVVRTALDQSGSAERCRMGSAL